jgi:hypothetical protein
MNALSLRMFGTVLGVAVCFAATARANVITVNNFSFETLPADGLPFGCGGSCLYSTEAIPGWSITGAATGQFQPGTQLGDFAQFSTLSDGNTDAYTNAGTISQTVGDTVQSGVVYTLMVDLGMRNDLPFGASMDLLVNGNVYSGIGITPTAGNWSTYTATYTGLAADAGDAITIELVSSTSQGDFDNVQLSNSLTATPEPALTGALGLSMLGLMGFFRRKRALALSIAKR